MDANKTTEKNEPSEVANGFFAFAVFVVLIGNLLGNSMVLCVVYHQWKNVKQRVTNLLIANLACIDLLLGIVIVLGIIRIINFKSDISQVECQLGGFLSNALGAASILTLAVIAIDRYMAIVAKRGKRLKLFTVRIFIVCVWVTTISISLFPILFWGKYEYTEKSNFCKPKDGRFLLFLGIVCFVIPLSTMVFCYVNVFLKVRQHKKMIVQSQTDCGFKKEFKTTKIVFTVLTTFIVLWAPYSIIYVLSSNSDGLDTIPPGVFKFCGFLTAMHSMCNPIIYFAMTKVFRKTAIKLFRETFSCVLPANEETATTMDSFCCERASCSAKSTIPRAIQAASLPQILPNPSPEDLKI